MGQLRISDFSSLDFSGGWQHHFEKREHYTQRFLPTDIITVIFSSSIFGLRFRLEDSLGNDKTNLLTIDKEKQTQLLSVSDLPIGYYTITFYTESRSEDKHINSASFEICESLVDTVLLGYSHWMEEFSVPSNKRIYTRVEGGFLYNEKQFKADDELFRDQTYLGHNVGTYSYESHILTIGHTDGVPYWWGRKINLIFSVSDVTVNGSVYVRSEGASVEQSILNERYPLYVFKLEVEPSEFYSQITNIPYTRIHSKQFSKQHN